MQGSRNPATNSVKKLELATSSGSPEHNSFNTKPRSRTDTQEIKYFFKFKDRTIKLDNNIDK